MNRVFRCGHELQVAFTGDTSAEFMDDPNNEDVLRARLLIMEVINIHLQSNICKLSGCDEIA
jgi:hypothetical protein